jgi:endoglucanase
MWSEPTFETSRPTPPYSCGAVFLFIGTHHCTSQWGGGGSSEDWLAAAEKAGNAQLTQNPSLLIFVEGTGFSTDLTKVHGLPVVLNVANRVVYSPHSYSFSGFSDYVSYSSLSQQLRQQWGYILTQNRPWTAPVWVGEFGATASQITANVTQGGVCGTIRPARTRHG